VKQIFGVFIVLKYASHIVTILELLSLADIQFVKNKSEIVSVLKLTNGVYSFAQLQTREPVICFLINV